jgi:hypothetical protein
MRWLRHPLNLKLTRFARHLELAPSLLYRAPHFTVPRIGILFYSKDCGLCSVVVRARNKWYVVQLASHG